MSDLFTTLVILAVICEATVEWVKHLLPEFPNRGLVDEGIALVMGLVLAYGADMDLLGILEIEFAVPHVGMALAGLAIARGAGYIHDLVDRINETL